MRRGARKTSHMSGQNAGGSVVGLVRVGGEVTWSGLETGWGCSDLGPGWKVRQGLGWLGAWFRLRLRVDGGVVDWSVVECGGVG
jgi:hypothetical protein